MRTLWQNIRNNRFIIISGLETLFLGAYLIYASHVFDEADKIGSLLRHASDPIIAIVLIIVGTFGVMVGLFNMVKYKSKRIAVVAMIMIWTAYFVAFTWHDLHTFGLSFGTILIGFVLVRLFAELAWGEKV